MQPVLAQIPTKLLVNETGYSRRMINYLKAGNKRPSKGRFAKVLAAASEFATDRLLEKLSPRLPDDDMTRVKLYLRDLTPGGCV